MSAFSLVSELDGATLGGTDHTGIISIARCGTGGSGWRLIEAWFSQAADIASGQEEHYDVALSIVRSANWVAPVTNTSISGDVVSLDPRDTASQLNAAEKPSAVTGFTAGPSAFEDVLRRGVSNLGEINFDPAIDRIPMLDPGDAICWRLIAAAANTAPNLRTKFVWEPR